MKRIAAACGFLLVVSASANAYADIFAAVCVVAPAPRTDLDIALLRASDGLRTPLPAGLNTTADEIHPSITPDGKRLVFARVDEVAETVRIIVVDLSTGVMSDLFTGLETAQNPPFGPAITPDGTMVVTGGPTLTIPATPQFTLTSLQSFPTGPYAHTPLSFPFQFPVEDLVVVHVAAAAYKKLAAADQYGTLYFVRSDGTFGGGSILGSGLFSDGHKFYYRPTMAATNPQYVFFEERESGRRSPGDIVFRPATLQAFHGPPTKLPAIVNTSRDESQPAVSADGRYLAFVRDSESAGDFLFVWDTVTQTLLNPRGVSLGGVVRTNYGASVSLFSRTLLNTSVISSSGNLTFSLASTSGIGILVQRIVGRTILLDRPAYELEMVGRVPLGTFPEGHGSAFWDLTVNNEPLEPGRYLVTLRAVDGTIVRELGRPHVLVIPGRH